MHATVYCHTEEDEKRLNFPGLAKKFEVVQDRYIPRYSIVRFSTESEEEMKSLMKYCEENKFPLKLDEAYFSPRVRETKKCYVIDIDSNEDKNKISLPPFIPILEYSDEGDRDTADIHYRGSVVVDTREAKDYIVRQLLLRGMQRYQFTVTEKNLCLCG